jgi:hypothetical protein
MGDDFVPEGQDETEGAAPKGQESLAQGLPWFNFPLALALKGPSGTAKIGPAAG